MYPPVDKKEGLVSDVKRAINSTATHDKWAINNAGRVREILNRIQIGFTFERYGEPRSAEVFCWERI
jgi:hypothetical protein